MRELSGETRGAQRDGVEMSDRVLRRAIVVHGPDFFVSGAGADEVDLAFGNAGDSAAEAEDDFVGKAVGNQAGVVIRGRFAILLGEHLRVLRILYVEEPTLHLEGSVADAEVAKGEHGGLAAEALPTRPDERLQGLPTSPSGIEALGDHIEDAGLTKGR